MAMTRVIGLFCVILAAATAGVSEAKIEKDVTKLQIGVKYRPAECTVKAHNGDQVELHYSGYLTDGTKFDSSLDRGDPFAFKLGRQMVIKGWEHGVLGMCVGEKRKLKIPSDMGYGDKGSPPKIPGGATLIFDVEMIAINGDPSAKADL